MTYDALVKLVQDVAKVDATRYTIELWSLVSTNIGVARPIIENDNEVSCIMDVLILKCIGETLYFVM